MVNQFKLHPWHGIRRGNEAPELVTSFIEIIPSDTVKYEIDKHSGYLMVDRPQKFSNIVPALYGFIPQTYCAENVAACNMAATGRTNILGDGDPLDILVLTEREITHGDIIVRAIPIGGFRLIDNNEADDKIIAVLNNDEVYNMWKDLKDVPKTIINRLKHYFLTYKQMPDKEPTCYIDEVYGRDTAHEVINASIRDYERHFMGKA
ncbi:MAG: inorganic pyrophosphatase [Saprospiraceae bacterium]|nr:inorganic pyrophosphatase [Saprospiraceae bacterium]